jgi:NAD(P)-dependent dehydrogenase (short-subunit alcohol dehydrogenase family)
MTGGVRLLPGDVADLDWCCKAREQIGREYGRLDYLVCNAAPVIKPLPFDACAASRITPFVSESLEMGCNPMLGLLELLARSGGWAVVVSSSYVTSCPIQMAHYVAAKSALEAMTRVAAREFRDVRFLIVRPPRILTDQTNAPMERGGLMSTTVAAAGIVRQLLQRPAEPGKVVILEDFG